MSAPVPSEPVPLRLFVALWPDEDVRKNLRRLVRQWRRTVKGRWAEPQKLHLTLAFLGAVPAGRLPELAAMMQCLDSARFELVLDRLEYWRRNRILCVGATQVPQTVLELVQTLNSNLSDMGLPMERRPFKAHLTLARKADAAWSAMPLETPILWSVERVVLVESRISKTGSSYNVWAEKLLWTMPDMTAMK